MKKMAGTLKLDLALYREMAAFSSFGFDESTQELLRRGAALTEMLKQQQFRPLASEIQVIVLFNGIRERITPKQIRFYEYQVVPNLLFGLRMQKNKNALQDPLSAKGINSVTISTALASVTSSAIMAPASPRLEAQKYALEREITLSSDALCSY